MRHIFSFPFFLLLLTLSPFAITASFQNVSALTPVADLTGDWSGFAQVTNVEGTCSFSGKVNAHLTQHESSLQGSYSFVVTSATPSQSEYYCYEFTIAENIQGTLDGSRITLYSDSATFSGWYASSGIKLNISSDELIGTTQLSPTGFTPPAFAPKDADGDGIPDSKDACPNDPEDFVGAEDGCPEEETDSDDDGFLDSEDACPNEPEDFVGAEDGCPEEETDSDDDGIPDYEDACPNDPEDDCPEQNAGEDEFAEEEDYGDDEYAEEDESLGDLENEPEPNDWVYENTVPVPEPELDKIISEHVVDGRLWNGMDSTGLAKELLEFTPEQVTYVLDQQRGLFGHADKIATEYVSLLTDEQIKNLPTALFDKLRGSIDDWWRTSWDKEQLNRLDSAYDGKKTSFKPQTSNDDPDNPVVFVNGVLNTKENHDESCQKLANALGRECVGFYNLSEGAYGDFKESAKGKVNDYVPPSGKELQKYIEERLNQNLPVEIHAHSQGAIIVSAALKDPEIQQLLKEHPDMVIVHTHGGASWTFPDGVDYRHDAFRSDVLAVPFGKALSGETNRLTGPEYVSLNHAMDLYTENYPKFTIKQFSKFGSGIDTEALADYLATRTQTEAKNVIQTITDPEKQNQVAVEYYQNLKTMNKKIPDYIDKFLPNQEKQKQ